MRFKFFDKLLLVIVLLFNIAIAAVCVGMALSLITYDMIAGVVGVLTNGYFVNNLIMGAVGIVLLIFAFRLFVAMGKKKDVKQPKPVSTLVNDSQNGCVYITLSAIDGMTQRFCRNNSKVRECISSIDAGANGILIDLKLAFAPETIIPETTDELQKTLKEYIETICGIKVESVFITVIQTEASKNSARVV